jgi:hypothetical protein
VATETIDEILSHLNASEFGQALGKANELGQSELSKATKDNKESKKK